VSCPAASFCVAVDLEGDALTFNGSTWSTPTAVDPGNQISSVSCPSTTFCVAVGNNFAPAVAARRGSAGPAGNAYTFHAGAWSAPVAIDPYGYLSSVSCPSETF